MLSVGRQRAGFSSILENLDNLENFIFQVLEMSSNFPKSGTAQEKILAVEKYT